MERRDRQAVQHRHESREKKMEGKYRQYRIEMERSGDREKHTQKDKMTEAERNKGRENRESEKKSGKGDTQLV